MQIDHGKNGTALGNVGQGDHRPKHGAVVVGDQLQIDGVGHVMQPRDDERSIDKAKDGGEHLTEGAGDTAEHHAGNERTDGPELAHLHQRLGSVFEQVQLVDAVAKPENQAAGDDRGNERRENLCGNGCRALQDVLIPLRRFVHRIPGWAGAADARDLSADRAERVYDRRHRVLS